MAPTNRIPPETDEDRKRWADLAAEKAAEAMAELLKDQVRPKSEVKDIAEEVFEALLKRRLRELGIDINGGIKESQADFAFLRSLRETLALVKRQIFIAMTMSFVGLIGLAFTFWAKGGFR